MCAKRLSRNPKQSKAIAVLDDIRWIQRLAAWVQLYERCVRRAN
jgi:hypothetical protein